MNGFCGAVDYEKNEIDFTLLKKMSRFLGGVESVLCAAALPCCSVVYCQNGAPSVSQPLCTGIRGQDYIAVATSDDGASAEDEYLAESMLCGYTDEGMSYLERLCGSICGAVFNSAFGETMLLSDGASDRAIYYIIRGGTLYFSSELRAVLCALEAYDGSVRIDGRTLRGYLLCSEEYSPHKLFCGVECVSGGEGIIFSSFGISAFKTRTDKKRCREDPLCDVGFEVRDGRDVCVSAERMLRLFGYPRFDFCAQISDRKRNKIIYKGLVAGLGRVLEKENCVLYKLFDAQSLKDLKILKQEKNIPARIRLAGMLYQTAIWFENENISL